MDSETGIHVKGIDQDQNSKGSGVKEWRGSTRVQRSMKSLQRVALAHPHGGGSSVDPTLSTAVPVGFLPPALWGHFVLSTCAGEGGCGNFSVGLQLGDTTLAVGNNKSPGYSAQHQGRDWRG